MKLAKVLLYLHCSGGPSEHLVRFGLDAESRRSPVLACVTYLSCHGNEHAGAHKMLIIKFVGNCFMHYVYPLVQDLLFVLCASLFVVQLLIPCSCCLFSDFGSLLLQLC